MNMSPEEFRMRFPMLEDVTHLASCSQGARSIELDQAIGRMMDSISQQGAPWPMWMAEVEKARQLFAEYIHADAEEIAVLPNASIGAYQVASAQEYSRHPRIVSTEMEFPSVGQVWAAQARHGAKIEYAGEADGYVDVAAYSSLVDESTALVSVPLVSYKNGARLPVREVAGIAHHAGARVFVDAYQAAGVLPIDVRSLDCDYLVTGSLKYLLGLPGIAFLYIRNGVSDQVEPSLTGWFGRPDPFDFDPRGTAFPPQARRMETGTPSIPSAFAATAGLGLLTGLDGETAWHHVRSLVETTAARLEEQGIPLYSPRKPDLVGPQVAVHTADAEDLGDFLRNRRIFASPRGNAVRLSFHYYNNAGDVEACVRAICDYPEFSAAPRS